MSTPLLNNVGKLTAEELKSSYLFGIPIVLTDTGEELSNDVYEYFIDAAYEKIAELYNIQVLPKERKEKHDLLMDQANRSFFMFHPYSVPILFDDAHPEIFPMKVEALLAAKFLKYFKTNSIIKCH